jgi:brefeldin A-resistance guanine nucleotide exchange factor 1
VRAARAHALTHARAHCPTQATDPGHDEAVLASICDVLLVALRCSAGVLLSDEAVCAVVQAAYHIGHQSGREGALLTGVSRRTLRDVVAHVFAQAPRRAADEAYLAALSAAAMSSALPPAAAGAAPRASSSHGSALPASPSAGEPPPVSTPRASSAGAPALPYGLPCCVEIFAFAASLAAFEDDAAPNVRDDLRLTGVQLASVALDTGAPAFASYPPLLCLARDELPRALVTAAAAPGAPPPLLSAACSLMVSIYLRLRPLVKHQLAAFLQFVLLPLGDGAGAGAASGGAPGGNGSSGNLLSEGARADAARIALEALADLCRQPGFGADLFANYDCDVRWPPLFEHTAALLSKAAFPGAAPLSGVNLVALEGVLALLEAMSERTSGAARASSAAARASSAVSASVTAPAALAAAGSGAGSSAAASPAAPAAEADPVSYDASVWAAPGRHLDLAAAALASRDVEAAAGALRRARYIKQRVAAGADHFNRDDEKGLAFLRAVHLLPPGDGASPADAAAVAAFLRFAAPLDKAAVGEYLGQLSPFIVSVLDAYAALFDFAGLPLDRALRLFLDGFLLPGEAQKISRCLEAFAQRFHACNNAGGASSAAAAAASGCVAADADSAYVLCYSIIMLNTDLHNPQVRNKMTLAQFIKNNRGTNAGADWPAAYLTDMYEAIAADEIRISAAGAPGGATSASWLAASRAAAAGEGGLLCAPTALAAALDGDLFALMWGPAVGALACVFEAGDASSAARGALGDAAAGFKAVARIAAAHGMGDVADHCVATLVRFTAPHNGIVPPPGSAAAGACGVPAVAFGADTRARLAAVTACGIAAKHGDTLRAGWASMLDLLLRMHKMGLVTLPAPDGGDGGGGISNARTSRSLAPPPSPSLSSSGILRGFSSLLSLDTEPAPAPPLTAAESEAAARAQRCGEQCRVEELLADSKFLETAALDALVRAVIWAAGAPGGGGAVAPEDEDTACVCLDLLGAITLRNRDRIAAIWPLVSAHLRAVVTAAGGPTPAAERALVTLLRLCQRLLPYKEELAEELLSALRMVLSLDAKTADALMPRLAAEVGTLLKVAGAHVGAASGWDTLCRLLTAAARHADASAAAYDALAHVMCGGVTAGGDVPAAAFTPCCAAAAAFAASRAGGDERSRGALTLLCAAGEALAARPPAADAAAALALWSELVTTLRRLAGDERPDVRDDALSALQRVLLAAEPLSPPAPLLASLYDASLLPLFGELVDVARRRGRDAAGAERALRHAIPALCKPLLQYLPALRAQLPAEEWARLWAAVLDRLAAAARVAASEELAEAVPEALKNCLLVMATAGALSPEDAPFWDMTWRRAAAVDARLTPALLQLARPSAGGAGKAAAAGDGAAAAAAAVAEGEAPQAAAS